MTGVALASGGVSGVKFKVAGVGISGAAVAGSDIFVGVMAAVEVGAGNVAGAGRLNQNAERKTTAVTPPPRRRPNERYLRLERMVIWIVPRVK